jgi:hypothetical protein
MIKHYLIPHAGNDHHPHIFRYKAVAVILGACLVLLSLSLAGSSLLKNSDFLGAIYASALVDLTNADRAIASLPSLAQNNVLTQAAELKAIDMTSKGYFAHNSPDGKTPWGFIYEAGYQFVYAGENLAVNFEESNEVENAWMNSPGHRANILSGKFTEVGIAVREGTYQGKDTVFVVQMFGKPAAIALAQPVPEQVSIPASQPAPEIPLADTLIITPSIQEVKGDSLEITEEVANESGTNLYIAAKDPIAEAIETAPETPKPEVKIPAQSIGRAILNFPFALNIFYSIIGLMIVFALAMLIAVEVHNRKPKVALVAALMLIAVTGAIYANSSTHLYAIASTLQ